MHNLDYDENYLQVPKRVLRHGSQENDNTSTYNHEKLSSTCCTTMRFVIISDTHQQHKHLEIPASGGDVLIHCGDFTNKGTQDEVDLFFNYLKETCDGKFKYIILLVGMSCNSTNFIIIGLMLFC